MTSDAQGPLWEDTLVLMRGLQKLNIDVALATLGRPLRLDQRREALPLKNLQIYEQPLSLNPSLWTIDSLNKAGDRITSLAKQITPGLIHLNHPSLAPLSWHSPATPRVVTGHWELLNRRIAVKNDCDTKELEEWNHCDLQTARGFQSSDLVIASSKALLTELEKTFGPFKRSQVIANGRDTQTSSQSVQLSEASSPSSFILTSLASEEGVEDLTTYHFLKSHLDWPICFVDPETDLNRSEFRSQLSKAPLYCLPATRNTSGTSVLEAALSGCALVLGETPSLLETWKQAALFADAHHPDSILHQLHFLIKNPEQRAEMAQRARARARFLSSKRTATFHVQIYEELIRTELPTPQTQDSPVFSKVQEN